jgi:hypothetical protein
MEEITKEWPTEFLISVEDVELSDPDISGSPLVTLVDHDGHTNTKKKKKNEEVQKTETDDEDSALEESRPHSPTREGGGDEEENKDKSEVTPPKDPLIKANTSKKRKVSLQKPSVRKKTRANKPQSKSVLTMDDVDIVIAVIEDSSEDIF